VDHREEIYLWPNPWEAQYWGTFTREGERLPQADGVEYLLLHIDELPPDHRALLRSIRGDFETVYEKPNVLLLRRRSVPGSVVSGLETRVARGAGT
jgi:hypothetical protein